MRGVCTGERHRHGSAGRTHTIHYRASSQLIFDPTSTHPPFRLRFKKLGHRRECQNHSCTPFRLAAPKHSLGHIEQLVDMVKITGYETHGKSCPRALIPLAHCAKFTQQMCDSPPLLLEMVPTRCESVGFILNSYKRLKNFEIL